MSSKRTTNNSTVTSLEGQSALINQVLEEGDIQVSSLVASPIDKTVPKLKKKTKSKQTTSSKETPLRWEPARDVSQPRAASASQSAAAAAVNQQEVVVPAQSTGTSGGASGDALTSQWKEAESPQGPPREVPGSLAAQGCVEAEAQEFYRRQQQWMWQQQAQPFPFQPFGNYVPNFQFGAGVNHFWDQEEPELPQGQGDQGAGRVEAPVVPQVAPQVNRQPDHVVSDNEEEEEEILPTPAVSMETFKDLVKGQLGQIKEADKVADPVHQDVADLFTKFLEEAQSANDMDKLAKAYPRVENVEAMKVPRLDAEVYNTLDQRYRTLDQVFQGIQRALLGALSACAPIMELTFSRDKQDEELNGLGQGLMDSIHLIAFAHNAISTRRREELKPQLSPVYANTLSRLHGSPEWLYGGELAETTKQCEVARKVGEKVIKRVKPGTKAPGQKKFRPNSSQFMGQPMFRAFNPYQMQQQVRFPSPQAFGYQQFGQQYFPGGQQSFRPQNFFGGFPRRQRFQRGGKQAFVKKQNK